MRRQHFIAGTLVIAGSALIAGLVLLSRAAPVQAQQGGGVTSGDIGGPLPPPKMPPDLVRLTPVEKLGKYLDYDHTLSDPPGYACASCHHMETGFTSPSSEDNLVLGVPPGVVPGRFENRKPQTYSYALFSPIGPYYDGEFTMGYVGGDFWDGRVPDLSGQSRQPPLDPNEMANIPTNGIYPPHSGGYSALFVEKIMHRPYTYLFKKVYGPDVFEKYSVPELYLLAAEANAAYMASGEISPFSSKYDASKYGVPPMSQYRLAASEERGRVLYFGKAQCSQCHSSSMFPPVQDITNGKDTFTQYCFVNIGVPKNYSNPYYEMTDCDSNPHGCNPLGTNYIDFGLGANPNQAPDGTRFMHKKPGDIPRYRGLFQTPTNRNVDRRPRPDFVKAYMHNGVFKSLKRVVHFYNKRNIAVNAHGHEVVFNLDDGPPSGYTRLFPPPEVLDNVLNPQGLPPSAGGEVGNLRLTDQQEDDIVAFLSTLSDGYTKPNPVGN